nr:hypothetical protein [Listeria cornellensis]
MRLRAAAWAANAALRAVPTVISPRVQARLASIASRGRFSFGYLSSK